MHWKLAVPIFAGILGGCAVSADALITDQNNGCVVHNPNPRSAEAINWSGDCQNGFAHGPGTVAWYLHGAPNGRFEGVLERGRMNGQGTAHYPSGNHYSGAFRNGVPNGSGTLFMADGRRIAGLWRNGEVISSN